MDIINKRADENNWYFSVRHLQLAQVIKRRGQKIAVPTERDYEELVIPSPYNPVIKNPNGQAIKIVCKQPVTHITIADLKDKETEEVVARGYSACSLMDNFSRKTGYNKARGRALKEGLKICQ